MFANRFGIQEFVLVKLFRKMIVILFETFVLRFSFGEQFLKFTVLVFEILELQDDSFIQSFFSKFEKNKNKC